MTHTMRRRAAALLIAATALTVTSCGDVIRESQSPVYLVMDSLLGSSGGDSPFTAPLLSDVVTNSSIANDVGRAVLRIAPKDISIAPSPNNAVTITRYRVTYTRSDGRNTPGTEVPYPFDGAVTGTVPPGGSTTLTFELVRHAAKKESPLVQLTSGSTVITTIAEVVFFGRDQVGNEIAVSGLIQVNFGNFGDS
jgi:hypothetical protein